MRVKASVLVFIMRLYSTTWQMDSRFYCKRHNVKYSRLRIVATDIVAIRIIIVTTLAGTEYFPVISSLNFIIDI